MLVSYRKKATHQQTLRPLAPLLCLLFSLSFNGAGGAAESPSPEPVKLIFDTDMDTDVDDIGAIAVVHAMPTRMKLKSWRPSCPRNCRTRPSASTP